MEANAEDELRSLGAQSGGGRGGKVDDWIEWPELSALLNDDRLTSLD